MTRTFLILFLATSSCLAQDSTKFDKLVPRTALKFTPFTLINFYSSLELSLEQKIAHRLTAQIGYGYVFNFSQVSSPQFQDMRGYKIKLELRYYLVPSERYSLSSYMAVGGYLNAVDFDRETRQEECYDLSCTTTFIRYYNYVVNYQEHGFTLKYGFIKHFRKSIFIDFNAGWSFRFIDYDQPTLPPSTNGLMDENDGLLLERIPIEKDWFIVSPLVGFRVGYRFR